MAIEEEVIRRCADRGVTLGLGESCTGGLIGSLLVDVPGSSKVFVGGVTAYHNGPKRRLLNVPEEVLKHGGSVSEACVHAMAEGAREAFGATLGLGESGIAGPGGGSAEKPAGTVYIALSAADGTTSEHHVFPGSRRAYKLHVAEAALAMVLRWLDGAATA